MARADQVASSYYLWLIVSHPSWNPEALYIRISWLCSRSTLALDASNNVSPREAIKREIFRVHRWGPGMHRCITASLYDPEDVEKDAVVRFRAPMNEGYCEKTGGTGKGRLALVDEAGGSKGRDSCLKVG